MLHEAALPTSTSTVALKTMSRSMSALGGLKSLLNESLKTGPWKPSVLNTAKPPERRQQGQQVLRSFPTK